MDKRAAGVISFLREAFRRDGAEGDSVHMLCDLYESLAGAPAARADAFDLSRLSPREREVAQALFGGKRPTQIGESMGLSHHTVRNHLKKVFSKLGVKSQVELVARMGGRHG